jgi:pimeloyl-ACP methyl ester carboxylesterase
MNKKFVDNNVVKISYYTINPSQDTPPLVIIPGAISGAEDIYEFIKDVTGRYCIIISIRGRGNSSKPVSGYSKDEQISDIEAVIKEEKTNKLYLAGHSFGASLASAFAIKYPDKILGLILADFPPYYPKYSEKWAERILQNVPEIDKNFVNGIVRDGAPENLAVELSALSLKILILKAKENSLLENEKFKIICESLAGAAFKTINSGHEMFYENPAETMAEINNFINISV